MQIKAARQRAEKRPRRGGGGEVPGGLIRSCASQVAIDSALTTTGILRR